ncbi:PAS domain S-box protein [Longitalea luteola]|uniref:PAS domain S-box protein n=1 Tax=Longitalea luteola TaxID=2812563 RepID=UPI001A95BCBA|nr:PAS domain S-box protein [Longitalea luteola]
MLKQSKKSIPEVTTDYTALSLQTDKAGIIISASADLLSFTGKHQEELIGNSFKKIIDAADKTKLQALLNTGIDAGLIIQLAIKGRSGVHHIGFTAKYQSNSHKAGEIINWNAVPVYKPTPIAASKNSLLDNFFRYSNDLLCIIDGEGMVKQANTHFAQLLGYRTEEMFGLQFIQLVHPDDRPSFLRSGLLPISTNNNEFFEARFCGKDGRVEELSWSTSYIDEDYLVLAIGRAVTANDGFATDLKEVRQELQEVSDRYKAFVQQSSEIIWRCELQTPIDINDPEEKQLQQLFEGYLAECNEQMAHFYGFETTAGIIGQKVSVFFDPNEPITEQVVREFIQQGYKIYRRLSMHIDHQGNKRYFLNNLVGIVENGKLLRVWTTQNEITQLRMAEKANRYQASVLENVSDAIYSTDRDFLIKSWNHAAEKLYGISAEEIMGHTIQDFFKYDYHNTSFEKLLEELYASGTWSGEISFTRPSDSKKIILSSSISLLRNKKGHITDIIAINKDITEARLSQENLRINEERYRSVVHALGEGILMYDKNGQIIACNRSAEMILKVPASYLNGKPTGVGNACIYEDGTPFPPDQYPSLVTLRTGKSLQNVIMGYQRSDGSLVWISINTEPVYYTEQRVHPDAVVASFVDITQKKAAEIELKQSQQQLKEYSERITNILASITDGFIAVDKNLKIFLWNHAVENITGLDAKQVIGTSVEKIFPDFIGTTAYQQYIEAINKGTSSTFEHFLPAFARWLETSVYPFSQGAFIYFRDITDRKKQERLLELEKEVLAINAQPTASLKTTIDYFLNGLEKTYPGMVCSVVMLNEDKQTMRHLSAPGLPDEFAAAVNGVKTGPAVAACGTAIYRKETVISVDIETDPLWEGYRTLTRKFGLRSCWSFPIVSAGNEVLATISVYHTYPATPTDAELQLFDRVNSLLRIIIENKNAELKIRLSNERYLLVTKATNDAIWDWDVNTNSLYWGEGIYTLFGIKPGYVENAGLWEHCIHPEDRDRVVNGINKFIKDSTSKIWEDEYRFIKPNGEYALVFDRGFLIFDHSGKIARMVGSMQDITGKKELEKKLLKQEVDKHKIIAQAVVNAQEKERAEIGKELHDNVNQILSTAKLYLELAQTDDDSRLDLINRSTKNISDAINEIRTISRSLVPPSIGDLGLIDSVQDLVENIKATKRLHVEFYYSGTIDSVLDEKRKLMLFRIIQEQVNNVLKHASAKNLVIELIADSEGCAVDLTISDDGQGFELDKVRSKKGVGLSNIASRAQLFNGSVHVVTALGEGCKLKINVPISNI